LSFKNKERIANVEQIIVEMNLYIKRFLALIIGRLWVSAGAYKIIISKQKTHNIIFKYNGIDIIFDIYGSERKTMPEEIKQI
jgi:hypothetical protein